MCIHSIISELQPRVKGWLLASVDGKTVGIIPANYVKVLGKRRGTKVSNYPVQNQLKAFDEQNRDIPDETFPQTGSTDLTSNATIRNETPVHSLVQSSSAINLENQSQSGFRGDNMSNMDAVFQGETRNMDAVFRGEASPLDSVPELTPNEQNDRDDKL